MAADEQRSHDIRAQQDLTQSVGGRLTARAAGGFLAWFRRLLGRRTT
jgi:hypothetical protein